MSETREEYHAGDAQERRPKVSSTDRFTLELDRLELISLNRGLACWLGELRLKRYQADSDELKATIDQALGVAQRVARRVDDLLGIR